MSHNEDLIKLVRLIEGKQQFAGELVGQRPGDQVRGTDKAVAKGSDHPFKGRLVGEETTLEDILAKKYQDFKEIQKKEKEQKQDEAANPAQQAAIAIAMKKAGKKPKSENVEEEKQRLDPKCWTGYRKAGTKMKGGVRVNNCVKVEDQGVAEGLNEFAPPGSGNNGDDGFSEETLKRLAAQWYNGDEDPRAERTLMAAGWEIGQDEGYDDEPGVFVVRAGDVNGNSYISWPAHELKQGVAEGKKSDRYHIVGKDGKPVNLASYADRASAIKDRDEKYPGAVVQQVGPRGKVKGVAEGSLNEFAPSNGGGDGRWYTDDEIADIIGEEWFEFDLSGEAANISIRGEHAKILLVQEAQTYFEDMGYHGVVVQDVRDDEDYLSWYISGNFTRSDEGVAEDSFHNPGQPDSPVASAIIRRILLQRTDLLSKYGPEQVGAAVDEVADFVGDVDEIGSSDVSSWVRHVEQLLDNSIEEEIDEAVAPTPEGDQVWIGRNNKEFLLRKEAENQFKLYDKVGEVVKSWFAPKRYIPFYLEELGLQFSQLGTIALKDKGWSTIKEVDGENPIDKITVDVPLMLRIMEYAREDANTDMDLHDVAERLIKLTSERGSLSMDDYDEIVSGSQVAEAIPPTTSTATTPPTGAKPAIGANAAPTSGSISPDEQTALNKIAQTPAMKQQFDKLLGQTQPAQANAPMKLSPDQENALDKLKTNAGLKSQYDRLIKQANPQAKI